jgi:hypothetical protein
LKGQHWSHCPEYDINCSSTFPFCFLCHAPARIASFLHLRQKINTSVSIMVRMLTIIVSFFGNNWIREADSKYVMNFVNLWSRYNKLSWAWHKTASFSFFLCYHELGTTCSWNC